MAFGDLPGIFDVLSIAQFFSIKSTHFLWIVLIAGLGLVLYREKPPILDVVASNPFYVALLLIFLLSVIWSVDPVSTLRSSLLFTTMFGIGCALAVAVGERARYMLLQSAFFILIIGGVIAALFFPEIGLSGAPHEGMWKGLSRHKNWLGYAAALWVLFSFSAVLSTTNLLRVILGFSAAVVALFVLVFTGSVTSYFGLIAGALVMMVLFFSKLGWMKKRELLMMFVAVLLFVSIAYVDILEIFGRNQSLTGRWELWQTLLPLMQERPWLGYGYDAFLRGEGVIEKLGRWQALLLEGGDVHNGFVRLQLDVGIVGVVLGLAVMVHLSMKIWQWACEGRMNQERYIAAGVWTMIFVHQITETSMFMPVSISVVLMVYTTIAVNVRERR